MVYVLPKISFSYNKVSGVCFAKKQLLHRLILSWNLTFPQPQVLKKKELRLVVIVKKQGVGGLPEFIQAKMLEMEGKVERK